MTHTPEPWKIKGQDIIGNEINGYVCTWSGREADAHRIVACVNNCAGINPEAIGKMRDTLKAVAKYDGGKNIMSEPLCPICNNPGNHDVDCPFPKIQTALALAKE